MISRKEYVIRVKAFLYFPLIGTKACLCLLFNQLIQSKRSKILGKFLKIRSKKRSFLEMVSQILMKYEMIRSYITL